MSPFIFKVEKQLSLLLLFILDPCAGFISEDLTDCTSIAVSKMVSNLLKLPSYDRTNIQAYFPTLYCAGIILDALQTAVGDSVLTPVV